MNNKIRLSGVKVVDLTGKTFSMLHVVSLHHRDPEKRRYYWNCICSCGGSTVLSSILITSGKTQSCGCLRSHNKTHGESKGTSEYSTWKNIKQRCHKPKNKAYKNYGGRGITVCDRWFNSYENFLSDMGRRPTPLHTLERKDNDKGYSPENCKWATRREQVLNRRNCRILTIDTDTKPFADWCIQLNKNYYKAYDAIYKRGESPKQVLYGK